MTSTTTRAARPCTRRGAPASAALRLRRRGRACTVSNGVVRADNLSALAAVGAVAAPQLATVDLLGSGGVRACGASARLRARRSSRPSTRSLLGSSRSGARVNFHSVQSISYSPKQPTHSPVRDTRRFIACPSSLPRPVGALCRAAKATRACVARRARSHRSAARIRHSVLDHHPGISHYKRRQSSAPHMSFVMKLFAGALRAAAG